MPKANESNGKSVGDEASDREGARGRSLRSTEIQLVEITKKSEKKKWLGRFRAAYDGELIGECSGCYEGGVRFLVARREGRDLGFLRITDKTALFEDTVSCPVWEASEGYVKPAYRHRGVMREMLGLASERHDVRLLLLEKSRLFPRRDYYDTLGFGVPLLRDDGLVWLLRTDFAAELQEALGRENPALAA